MLEQSPGTASSYVALADYYMDNNNMDNNNSARAILDYGHALELAPGTADVHDRLALAYYKQGSRSEAIAQWQQAFLILRQQVDGGRLAETFYTDFSRACEHLRARKLFAELKPDIDLLMRAYLRRNGNYRSNALLRSVFISLPDPGAATAWLMDLAAAADDPATILGDIVEAPWVPLQQRAPVYRFILQAKKDAVTKSEGLQKESSQQVLTSWQLRWIKYLVETRQYVEAADAIDKMSTGERSAESLAVASLELRVSAQTGTIDSILARYRTDPLNAPSSEVLRSAARQLLESGDKQSAGKILEFVFARDIEDHKMIAVNFLGLAEIRIAQGDLPGAVGLLRRLVVVVGNPFENLDAAATLLEKTGHNPEAIEFLDELVKSAPWESAYRVRLARAKTSAGHDPALAQNDLVAVASATTVPYSVRITAAVALVGGNRSSEIGSPELNLLAATDKPATSAADRPFFYDARLKAAEQSSDVQIKIKLLGNALADTPSRDDARLPLFLAADAARSDQFARAIIQPLLRQGFLNSVPAPAETGSDPMGDANYPADTQPDGSSISFSPPASVQQRQAAKALGNLLARLGRLDEASRYLRIALQLEDTAGGRNQIKSSIAEVNARLRRQRLNSQRQPILHEALEQDRLVRPRLVARTVPARIPPAKAGPKS